MAGLHRNGLRTNWLSPRQWQLPGSCAYSRSRFARAIHIMGTGDGVTPSARYICPLKLAIDTCLNGGCVTLDFCASDKIEGCLQTESRAGVGCPARGVATGNQGHLDAAESLILIKNGT